MVILLFFRLHHITLSLILFPITRHLDVFYSLVNHGENHVWPITVYWVAILIMKNPLRITCILADYLYSGTLSTNADTTISLGIQEIQICLNAVYGAICHILAGASASKCIVAWKRIPPLSSAAAV